MNKIKIIITLFLLIILLIMGCTSDEDKYQSAMKLIENNNYDEAIKQLEVIQNYKDSKEIIKNNSIYNDAVKLFNKKDYKKSITKFESISTYRDSKDYISKINDVFSLEDNEKIYQISIKMYENNDLAFAKKKFEELGDYKDSKEYLDKIRQKQEITYNESIKLIKNNNYEDAYKNLEKLKDYKNTKTLINYVKAYQDYKKFGTDHRSFRLGVGKMINQIPDNYKGELDKVILSFKNKVSKEISSKEVPNDPKKLKKDIVRLIEDNNYSKALDLIFFKEGIDNEFKTLNLYLKGVEAKNEKNTLMMEYYFTNINPEYKGVLSNRVIKEVLKHMTLDEWKTQHKFDELVKEEREHKEAQSSKPEPTIGMTAQEVKNSSWGKPTKINKTITKNTTSEQWVYSLDRYVYLENGVVTAIQKSE